MSSREVDNTNFYFDLISVISSEYQCTYFKLSTVVRSHRRALHRVGQGCAEAEAHHRRPRPQEREGQGQAHRQKGNGKLFYQMIK